MTEQLPDRIGETFSNRTVFISGGSGFIGKVLIEKLLRCTNIKRIYILLREKKGKSPEERITDLFDNVDERPLAIDKAVPICGDVTEVDLGISQKDRKILQNEVDVIYHLAASTRFDDSVKRACKINTRGTKYMLDLAKQCKNLKMFVHVSSAYTHPKEKILYEKIYQPAADPELILKSINFDDGEDFDENTEKLLGDCPNTYTFSKSLAEGLVAAEMDKLPIILTRPSIVVPTLFQPFPGWCNNLQGPMGLFVGAGKGIIRTMHVKSDSYADFLPCDLVVNGLLISVWYGLTQDRSINVWNITASPEHAIAWDVLINTGKDVIYNVTPFNGVVWYPGGAITSSKFLHTIKFYLFQIIPAIFIDFLLMILGYPTLLYKIQRRIETGSELFDYYTMKAWNFTNTNRIKPFSIMNEREKKLYPIDVKDFNLKNYLIDCIHGVRLYNLKETDDTLPAARRHMKVMWCVDKICKSAFIIMTMWLLFKWIVKPIFGL